MEIRQCLLTENTCFKRNQEGADSRYTLFQRRGPLGVMLHSTGANNPTLRRYLAPDDGVIGENRYNNHWNRPEATACVHAFIGLDAVGEVRVYQTLPWNYRGWHCGRSGNDTHISIELCEDGLLDEAYQSRCFHLAAELTAEVCRLYGLDPLTPGVVVDHAEGYALGIASNHGDVGHWLEKFGKTMDDFRQEVAQIMAQTAPEMPGGQEDALIALIDRRIEAYRKVSMTLEDVPVWARDTVAHLVEQGILRGTGAGLELSEDLTRMLVMLDRLGLSGRTQANGNTNQES